MMTLDSFEALSMSLSSSEGLKPNGEICEEKFPFWSHFVKVFVLNENILTYE